MNEEQNSKVSLAVTLKTAKYLIRFGAKHDKRLFYMYIVKFIGNVLGEFKTILLPKLLMDELGLILDGAPVSEHLRTIIIYVALTIIGELVSNVLTNIADSHINVLREKFANLLAEEISLKSMTMDFQHTEDPDALDKQNKAKEGVDWYSQGVVGITNCLFEIVYNILATVASIVIIAIYCPLLLPVQALTMGMVCFFNVKKANVDTKFFLMLAKSNRIFSYVYYELADFRYGKEIRLYNATDMMAGRADKYANIQNDLWKEEAAEEVKFMYGSCVANAIRDGASYFYMGYRTLKGFITVGDFSICVAAASRLYRGLLFTGQNFTQLLQRCNYAHKFLEFMDYPDALDKGETKVKECDHVIEFKDVSFKYPRTDEYVLSHINITIKPGEHLSIVGLNGAGKTTFVKLLCRLYDVTEGEILIDGINIKEYSEEEYRKLFAVVFQDFKLFAFSLKDNIKLGDESEGSDEKVEEVLKLSGLYEDAVKLDKGLDTILFKSFDEHGTELSGGQQQKAAISRALYKNAPVVILDEPTAALDPIAEYDIYSKFDTLVGGKSAIYISHRLSSCKFCDRIAVFADKTIKEYGTHDELLRYKDGIYANMFMTQAKYYVENA